MSLPSWVLSHPGLAVGGVAAIAALAVAAKAVLRQLRSAGEPGAGIDQEEIEPFLGALSDRVGRPLRHLDALLRERGSATPPYEFPSLPTETRIEPPGDLSLVIDREGRKLDTALHRVQRRWQAYTSARDELERELRYEVAFTMLAANPSVEVERLSSEVPSQLETAVEARRWAQGSLWSSTALQQMEAEDVACYLLEPSANARGEGAGALVPGLYRDELMEAWEDLNVDPGATADALRALEASTQEARTLLEAFVANVHEQYGVSRSA